MDEQNFLADRFEENRSHLRAVAYRMLGSRSEADDAVQETWIRVSRAGTSGVENLGGWMTTIVARVCLNVLRSRGTRPERLMSEDAPEPAARVEDGVDPEHEALLADAVGPALLVVLDALPPAERLAFVLHDMFAVPFDEIALIVDRSPEAARQLASRARRRVQGYPATGDQGASASAEPDRTRQRHVVDAFLAASRSGDFDALLAVLDPEVVVRADGAAVRAGAAREVRGARAVAETFAGRARGARPALIDGAPGLVWAQGGRPRVLFNLTIVNARIVEIELVADPARLDQLEFVFLDT